MGRIVISQMQETGMVNDRKKPVYAGPVLATTNNALTTTTGVQVTTDGRTGLLRVTAITGAHRLQLNASANTDADTNFYYIGEGETIDVAIVGGTKFVYRADA